MSAPKPIPKSVLTRRRIKLFRRHIEESPRCHIWVGATNGRDLGLVQIEQDGKFRYVRAHRMAYLIANPDWDQGGTLRRMCNNSLCVNPEHMEIKEA